MVGTALLTLGVILGMVTVFMVASMLNAPDTVWRSTSVVSMIVVPTVPTLAGVALLKRAWVLLGWGWLVPPGGLVRHGWEWRGEPIRMRGSTHAAAAQSPC